jgi:hypothetical protein
VVLRPLGCVLAIAILGLVACSDDEEEEPAVSDLASADAGPDRTEEKDSGTTKPIPVYEVDCPIGVAVEHEPNDTKETATSFTDLSFCGVLATGQDVDYATFVVPDGKKVTLFQAVISGKVDFELTAGGKTFGPADTEQFAGGTWLVKAFAKDAQPGKYRFRIQLSP